MKYFEKLLNFLLQNYLPKGLKNTKPFIYFKVLLKVRNEKCYCEYLLSIIMTFLIETFFQAIFANVLLHIYGIFMIFFISFQRFSETRFFMI